MELGEFEEVFQVEPAPEPIPEYFEIDEDANAPLQAEPDPSECPTSPVETPAEVG